MLLCETIIRNASVFDGTGAEAETADVALSGDRILAIGRSLGFSVENEVDAEGLALAPGFIDAHTHDDLSVIADPVMLPKLSQGVTTVIVGNCGICTAPVTLHGNLPDPMNLLGDAAAFRYLTFAAYKAAIQAAAPAVNVAALVGHTALRNNQMDRLDRPATSAEIAGMRG
jgi:N-acyl-D-amino-acid deacylase